MEDVIPSTTEEALRQHPRGTISNSDDRGCDGQPYEAEEEEWPSSTLGKDDNEGGDDDGIDQVENSPEEYIERQVMIQTEE